MYPGGTYTYNHGSGWAPSIYAFAKSKGIFTCPDDPSVPGTKGYTITSYALNADIHDIANNALAAINSPANTVESFEILNKSIDIDLSVDNDGGFPQDAGASAIGYPGNSGRFGNPYWQYATGYLGGVTPAAADRPQFNNQPTGRHTDGSNYLFCDGHVKWLRGSAVSPGPSAAQPADAQGATPAAPFAGGTFPSAAGTGNSSYAGTFSTI